MSIKVIPHEVKALYRRYIDDILADNNILDGPFTTAVSELVRTQLGSTYNIVVNSYTAAWVALFSYIDVKGRTVLVSDLSDKSISQAAFYLGATVTPIDIKSTTEPWMDPDFMSAKIGSDVAAVIVTHTAGYPATTLLDILNFCEQRNIPVIEDAQYAYGASSLGIKIGSSTRTLASVFSFDEASDFPCTIGLITSADRRLYDWLTHWIKGQEPVNMPLNPNSPLDLRSSEMNAALCKAYLMNNDLIVNFKRRLAVKLDDVFASYSKITIERGSQPSDNRYVVFDVNVRQNDGKVYANTISNLYQLGLPGDYVNSAEFLIRHTTVPIYYGWHGYNLSIIKLKDILIFPG